MVLMRKDKNRKMVICKRCGNERYNAAKGLCNSCYNRLAFLAKEPVACDRCLKERPTFAGGLCKPCYQTMQDRPEATLSGSPEHRDVMQSAADARPHHREHSGKKWDGGRFIDPRGYVRIINPEPQPANAPYSKRYLMEHRYVMEQLLGRGLKASEVVHHINHVKTDNRPENLMVLSSVSEHRKIHVHEDGLAREAERSLRESYRG